MCPWRRGQRTRGPVRFSRSIGYLSHSIGPDFFESLDIPLLQGRSFEPLDSAPGAEPVMIIDERLARRLRPDGSALGCLVQYGTPAFSNMSPPCRVVGVVPDARRHGRPGELPANLCAPSS